jgi:hypothetical protein
MHLVKYIIENKNTMRDSRTTHSASVLPMVHSPKCITKRKSPRMDFNGSDWFRYGGALCYFAQGWISTAGIGLGTEAHYAISPITKGNLARVSTLRGGCHVVSSAPLSVSESSLAPFAFLTPTLQLQSQSSVRPFLHASLHARTTTP